MKYFSRIFCPLVLFSQIFIILYIWRDPPLVPLPSAQLCKGDFQERHSLVIMYGMKFFVWWMHSFITCIVSLWSVILYVKILRIYLVIILRIGNSQIPNQRMNIMMYQVDQWWYLCMPGSLFNYHMTKYYATYSMSV